MPFKRNNKLTGTDEVTTATGISVPGDPIEQLLFTEDWLTRVRAVAHCTISDRA
ncbi:hypothetical protein ABZX40_38060 [Streptomyces sp. NPDC004610]|uniref:hypothetical protein n=1 Tax=unclassified Streptomyces TaxID=2593676 RepID=UPI0033B9FD8F